MMGVLSKASLLAHNVQFLQLKADTKALAETLFEDIQRLTPEARMFRDMLRDEPRSLS